MPWKESRVMDQRARFIRIFPKGLTVFRSSDPRRRFESAHICAHELGVSSLNNCEVRRLVRRSNFVVRGGLRCFHGQLSHELYPSLYLDERYFKRSIASRP